MNLTELEKKLLAAARAQSPEARVPFAFAQRVMARLQTPPPLDELALWARALWRAAAPCVAVAILLLTWSFLAPGLGGQGTDLAEELENTVLAAVDSDGPVDPLW
jgi:hypothetical protein